MKGGEHVFAVAVGVGGVGVHEQDLRSGFGAEDTGVPVELAEFFPNGGVFLVAGPELEHRVGAALRGQLGDDADAGGDGLLRDGGGFEFDGEEFFERRVFECGGVAARPGDEEHGAAEFLQELIESSELLGREVLRGDVAEDDEVEFEKLVLGRGNLGEERRVRALGDGGVALQEDVFDVETTVAQEGVLQIAEFPARRAFDVEDFDFRVYDAKALRDGVVVLGGFVVARVNARAQFVFADFLRRERNG